MGPWDGWNHMFGIGGVEWLLMLLVLLLFWGGVLLLAFLAIRYIVRSSGGSPRGTPGPAGQTALEILKERYARGEITREEYIDMRRDLET